MLVQDKLTTLALQGIKHLVQLSSDQHQPEELILQQKLRMIVLDLNVAFALQKYSSQLADSLRL